MQASQRTNRITDDNTAVIKNLLEFRRCLRTLVKCQQGFATEVDRIEWTKNRVIAAAWSSQLVRRRYLQHFYSPGRLTTVQRHNGAQGGQIAELDRGVHGEALLQIVGQRLRLRRIARQGKDQGRTVLHLPIMRKLQRGRRPLPGNRWIREKCF